MMGSREDIGCRGGISREHQGRLPSGGGCKLRLEEVQSGKVKVKAGGLESALEAEDQYVRRPREKKELKCSGRKGGSEEARVSVCILTT